MLLKKYLDLCEKQLPENEQLLATRLDTWSEVWIAVNQKSQPSVLFSNGDQTELSDVKLQLVDVEFSRHSQILDLSGARTNGVFTVVRLNDSDPDLVHVFLRLLEVAFLELRPNFSNRSIRREIVRLADLFRRAESEFSDIVGLWGELHLIALSRHKEKAVQSWCSNPNAKFDFVSSKFSLEVKSTLRSRRTHRFSLEQLRPASDHPHFIASLLLLEKPAGLTVGSLVDSLSSQISNLELKSAFLKQCLKKVGPSLYSSETKFGVYPRNASLAIFEASAVPVPTVCPEHPISNLRFDLELTNLDPLPNEYTNKMLNFDGQ